MGYDIGLAMIRLLFEAKFSDRGPVLIPLNVAPALIPAHHRRSEITCSLSFQVLGKSCKPIPGKQRSRSGLHVLCSVFPLSPRALSPFGFYHPSIDLPRDFSVVCCFLWCAQTVWGPEADLACFVSSAIVVALCLHCPLPP